MECSHTPKETPARTLDTEAQGSFLAGEPIDVPEGLCVLIPQGEDVGSLHLGPSPAFPCPDLYLLQ